MDIRNIPVPKIDICSTQYLNKIYELNITQLEGYMKIEGLPEPPLDVNLIKSQVILKDFIGRVIEELSEGYESITEVVKTMEPVGWNLSLIKHKEYKVIINNLQNANEEQADAIGFFITLLLYSNILPEDIYEYISKELDKEINTLDDLMSYGVKILYELTNWLPHGGYIIFNKNISEEYYDIEYDKLSPYIPGYTNLNQESYEYQALLLWYITNQLNITRNLLKNRPWKQTQVMTKELEYQESLVKSFIMYLGYLAIVGFTSKGVLKLFSMKQQLNLWRQGSGY